MIAALLFLILFAILFPKALRFLFALLFIGMIVALGQAHAGYDCHDGKFDDCTAQWSRDHAPNGAVPLCLKWPCEHGDTPVVETPEHDVGLISCQTIIDGGLSHMPDIADYVLTKPHSDKLGYGSECRISGLVFAQCAIQPSV